MALRIDRLDPAARARLLSRVRARAGVTDRSAIEPVARTGDPLPASYAQEQFWFLQRMAPKSPVYTVPYGFRLDGPLDVPALRSALLELVRRHEALRTTFVIRPDFTLGQRVHDPLVDLPVVDVSTADEADLVAGRVLTTVFDPARYPLLRTVLLRHGPAEHTLLFAAHHLIIDGVSLGVIALELAALYAGAPLPEPALHFADFAAWQRNRLAQREDLVSYWQQALAGVPALTLPTDHPRPVKRACRGATQWFRVPARVTSIVRQLCVDTGTSPFMVLLAVYALQLARLAAQPDFAIGVGVAARPPSGMDTVVGPFLNTVALRMNTAGDPTFGELLDRVRDTTVDGLAHQELPFGLLVDELSPPREPGRNPIYQAMFGFGNSPISGQRLPMDDTLTMIPTGMSNGTSRVDLEIVLEEDGAELLGRLEYDTALFTSATATTLVIGYQDLLRVATANPTAPISTL